MHLEDIGDVIKKISFLVEFDLVPKLTYILILLYVIIMTISVISKIFGDKRHALRLLMTSSKKSNFTCHKSFAEIASRYDGFILDQFGVMHNGKESLPGAASCVEKLFADGKKLIILSNTSSPSETALSKLPKMGFDRACIEGAVTSGEEAGRHIREKYGSKDGDDSTKKKALWFTWAKEPVSPLPFLEKCGDIEVTNDPEEADFVIAHGAGVIWDNFNTHSMYSLGSFSDDGNMSRILPVLEKCNERGLPMVCANPDFIMVRPDGSTGHMPGKLFLI